MKITLYILLSIFLIGLIVNLNRHLKLRSLQKKRNNCDLNTRDGLMKAKEYNDRINKLMNFDNTERSDN